MPNDLPTWPHETGAERLAQLRQRMEAAGTVYTIHLHAQNVASTQDGVQTGLGALADLAPTFILKTEAGYLAAVIRGDTRLSYKKIKQRLGLKNVALASPEQVTELTGAEVGYVSLVNPGLKTIVDERLAGVETVFGGCGVPAHTLQISPRGLIALTQAEVFDFTEQKG